MDGGGPTRTGFANISSIETFGEQNNRLYLQGGFFNWSALKMTKCQTLRKFWHLELFWRDLHVIWHLVIFRADQLKKPPCMSDWDAIRQLGKPTKSYHRSHMWLHFNPCKNVCGTIFDFAILQEETSRWQKQQDQGRKKHWQWPGWGLTQDQPEQLAI